MDSFKKQEIQKIKSDQIFIKFTKDINKLKNWWKTKKIVFLTLMMIYFKRKTQVYQITKIISTKNVQNKKFNSFTNEFKIKM